MTAHTLWWQYGDRRVADADAPTAGIAVGYAMLGIRNGAG